MSAVPDAKRPRMDSETHDQVLSAPFTLDAIPPNHFYLSGTLFVTVRNFARVIRVHLRQFNRSDIGEFTPSRNGIALTPFLWQALSEAMVGINFVDLPSHPNEFSIVKNSLFLATVYNEAERAECISVQRFYVKKDFSREFLPGVGVLNEKQWKGLKDLRHLITENVISQSFGPLLRYNIMAEAWKQPPPTSDLSREAAEEQLNKSMPQVLCDMISDNISGLLVCTGCVENYANQLGHECITYGHATKFGLYGDLALCKINVRFFVEEFIKQNEQLKRFMGPDYVKAIEPKTLLAKARDLYIAADPDPFRM